MMRAPIPISVFLLLSLLSWNGQAAVVTVSPQSVIVGPLEIATFTCEGTGNTLHWLVQSSTLTPTVQQERNITVTDPGGPGNLSSILTVPALPINDGIGIGCFIAPAFSNSATLTIRGVSPVEDLQLNFTSNNSLSMTWSPPAYYSNDIPIESTVNYNVILTNKTGDIIVDTTITDTFIEVINITDCDTFNVSVTVIRGKYVSSNNTGRSNGSLSNTVPIEKNTQNFLKPNVTISLNCPPSKCWNILTVTSDDEVIDRHIFNGSDKNVSYMYTRELSPSKEYNYTIKVMNLRNISEHENYTIITTYQVSDVNIINDYTNGSVNVQCVFVSGSTADGCHVIFNDTTNGRYESFNITGSNNTMISLSTSGYYTVAAYDIIKDSYYGPSFDYPEPVYIDILQISATPTSSSLASKSSTVNNIVTVTLSSTVILEPENTTSTVAESADDDSVVVIVSSTVSTGVLLILIILAISAVTVKKKMKKMKATDFNAERATCHQPQAPTNHYQTVNEVAVQLTDNRAIAEDPYHVHRSEFIAPILRNTSTLDEELLPGQPRPSLTSTTTQETTLEDSITSIIIQSNDTGGATIPIKTNNRVEYADITINNDDTTAPVNPPTGAQPVMYSEVAGDITKRGAVTVYSSDKFVPPPSYDDAITQETSDVSLSQHLPFLPTRVTGFAFVHGKFESIPKTNIEDDYSIACSSVAEADDTNGEMVQQNETVAVNSDQNDSHRTDSDHTFVPGDGSIVPSNQWQPTHFPIGTEATESTTKKVPHIFTSLEEIEQSDEDYDSSEMVVLRNRFSTQSLKSDFKVNGKTTDMVKNAAEMVEDMTDDQVHETFFIVFCILCLFVLFYFFI